MSQDRPAALVLGAAVRPGGAPSATLRRRAETAVALWHAGHVGQIVASGAAGRFAPSEAEVIVRLCREGGVPDAALHPETRARSTEENLRFAAPILAGLGARRVLIVTDRWHGPRALLVARRIGLDAGLAPVPLQGARVWPTLRATSREGAALLWYVLRGLPR